MSDRQNRREQKLLPFEVWSRVAQWLDEESSSNLVCTSKYFSVLPNEDVALFHRVRNPLRLIRWVRLAEDFFDVDHHEKSAAQRWPRLMDYFSHWCN